MTVAVVSLAVALAASIVALLLIGRKMTALFDDLQACSQERLELERRVDDMADLRDASNAREVKAKSELAAALTALRVAEDINHKAREERANVVKAKIISSDSVALASLGNELFAGRSAAVAAVAGTGGDRSDAGPAPAVSVAGEIDSV